MFFFGFCRFLDDHELHLNNVELYQTLPFASGQALARGILDNLMSTTYFNASALRQNAYNLRLLALPLKPILAFFQIDKILGNGRRHH